MLSVGCPSCGKPAGVSLAYPDSLSCSACGFRGAMPPDARAQLDAGSHALAAVGVAERQLSLAQRSALERARAVSTSHGCLTLVLALLFAPLTLLGLYVLVGTLAEGEPSIALAVASVVLPPPLVLGVGTWLARRAIKRPIDRLRASCAASPPARPGEPAACHVCGGPVPMLATQSIARCGFCGADNLVDADALRAGAARHFADARHIADEVTRQARAVGSLASTGYARSIVAAIAAPVAAVLTCILFIYLSGKIELTPRAATYVLIDRGGRRCIAEAERFNGVEQVSFNHIPPTGFPNIITDHMGERLPPAKLVGRTLDNGHRITRVMSHPAQSNSLVLDDGSETDVTSSCLKN